MVLILKFKINLNLKNIIVIKLKRYTKQTFFYKIFFIFFVLISFHYSFKICRYFFMNFKIELKNKTEDWNIFYSHKISKSIIIIVLMSIAIRI